MKINKDGWNLLKSRGICGAFIIVCLILMPICGCGGSGGGSGDCKMKQALIEIEKIYQNAYLRLPKGTPFSQEIVSRLETRLLCQSGGHITAGPVGVYPKCSRHGSITDSEFLFFLLGFTSPEAKPSNPGDDPTFYIKAAFAAAKYFGSPESSEPDMKKALHYAQECADLNFAPAQHLLGVSYLTGYGVPVDRNMALRYLRDAARQGYSLSVDQLKALNEAAEPVDPPATSDKGSSAWIAVPGDESGKSDGASGVWLENDKDKQKEWALWLQGGSDTKKESPWLYKGGPDVNAEGSRGASNGEVEQRLIKAKKLFDSGVITREEYEETRRNIIKDL
jgi:hypothetical protein